MRVWKRENPLKLAIPGYPTANFRVFKCIYVYIFIYIYYFKLYYIILYYILFVAHVLFQALKISQTRQLS